MKSHELLMHPIRLRIVQSFLGETELTTGQLQSLLPDVPVATLYRHVGELAKHGVLIVTRERHVRGASEKTYQLAVQAANLSGEELRAMTPEELLLAFTVFTSGLIADFDRYVHGEQVDLVADQTNCTQVGFYASNDEVAEFLGRLQSGLTALLSNEPRVDRRRRILTAILIPQDSPLTKNETP